MVTTTKNLEQAELIAIRGLGFLASDAEELGRFLSLTGLGPDTLRAAAGDRRFLSGVLDHITGHEPLLLAFAADAGLEPARIAAAAQTLAGPPAAID